MLGIVVKNQLLLALTSVSNLVSSWSSSSSTGFLFLHQHHIVAYLWFEILLWNPFSKNISSLFFISEIERRWYEGRILKKNLIWQIFNLNWNRCMWSAKGWIRFIKNSFLSVKFVSAYVNIKTINYMCLFFNVRYSSIFFL